MLHLVCGKAGSGKSTLIRQLAKPHGTVLVSEDVWLSTLFADQLNSIADYGRCARLLQGVVAPHVVELLTNGVSVALDFAANTLDQRAWMREVIAQSGAAHTLHVLDVTDDVCLARLRARNAAGTHPFTLSDAQFAALSAHFVLPAEAEGFRIVRHSEPLARP